MDSEANAGTGKTSRRLRESRDLERRYLTIHEVAQYVGLSRWTIYSLVKRRAIPFIPLSKQALRFDRASIDDWMSKKEVKGLKEHLESLERNHLAR